ncbi:Hypothetical protein SRAE_1000079300 [Strongyloides ratti]|uniref:Uncharacterized protein n=1 Tax=Strongyloides ratti TaxID=34506 RepID=A0A090MUY5_STRRB|nr:Hypothetical protein SRAE_1000079300 [Strongyloides ratti]CEF62523.1 Hypothetical protein SRAE_1000079300 [Strongyloides ratti]
MCEKYFSGIPLKTKSKIQKENVTCSSPTAYCVNATATFMKWTVTARSCSDDSSIISKIYSNFKSCYNTSCVKINNLPLDTEANICCCQEDRCNESYSLYDLSYFLIFSSVIQTIKFL